MYKKIKGEISMICGIDFEKTDYRRMISINYLFVC